MVKCSVFIATSVDGYIATTEGDIDWLRQSGNHSANMELNPDMGFKAFVDSTDCMIMGRKCMEKISRFNLTDEQWPYQDLKIIVLSNTIKKPPKNLQNKVEMYSGSINELMAKLESEGYKHAYIDGGTTVTAFINLKLINQMIITKAPILLGKGIPLFGELSTPITLNKSSASAFPNDFIQTRYHVEYT